MRDSRLRYKEGVPRRGGGDLYNWTRDTTRGARRAGNIVICREVGGMRYTVPYEEKMAKTTKEKEGNPR